ncbi:hypothetical protein HDC30_002482 [Pseudomonas sp. JAI115]|uniref:hypothetical protein n=1 Tax=Pseudomonas sp. JAI115 TaxID=2723061 RepID=UPI00160B9A85|nr:hypothetical protein [Pseudomonas sp. JAI115]MBB6155259.1 hypothetical protein [Pseudomonas sp. JAI115]
MKAALRVLVCSPWFVWLTACVPLAERTALSPVGDDVRVLSREVATVSVGSVNFYSVSVFLYTEQTPQNYFSLTLDRTDVREGFTTDGQQGSERRPAIEANWNGRFYYQSRGYPRDARLAITSLTDKEAALELAARLVHAETGALIDLPPAVVKIRGDDLAALTERI